MQKISTVMLLTCVLWYAAASTMNTYAMSDPHLISAITRGVPESVA